MSLCFEPILPLATSNKSTDICVGRFNRYSVIVQSVPFLSTLGARDEGRDETKVKPCRENILVFLWRDGGRQKWRKIANHADVRDSGVLLLSAPTPPSTVHRVG